MAKRVGRTAVLIRVTHRCSMGCSHCLVEADLHGEHIAWETYEQALSLARRLGSPIVFLSGGEPTEHPEILDLIREAKCRGFSVYLMSNGLFLSDPERRKPLLNSVDGIQVTNDARFYPRRIEMPEHPKIAYITNIQQVSPIGRALTNKLEITRRYPHCFNIRSLTRGYGDLRIALGVQRMRMAFCTPSVNINGTVVTGESPSCSVIGTVEDDVSTLTRNLCGLTCSQCGLVNNCTQEQKISIGEARILSAFD